MPKILCSIYCADLTKRDPKAPMLNNGHERCLYLSMDVFGKWICAWHKHEVDVSYEPK